MIVISTAISTASGALVVGGVKDTYVHTYPEIGLSVSNYSMKKDQTRPDQTRPDQQW